MKKPNLRTSSKRARARGRPTKLNVTVQVTLCIALYHGKTLTAACREAGISLKTVCEWLARGRGEDPQRPRTKAYQAFGEAVERAQDRTVHERFAARRMR
jgi:transposase